MVPHTLDKTLLAQLKVGDVVNLESDILGKYVEKLLGARTGGVDLGLLERSGFVG